MAFPPLTNERQQHNNNTIETSLGGDDSSDSNSLRSGSTTNSTIDSSINNINNKNADESNNTPTKSYKETQFDTMLESSIIPLRDLRKLAWNGIPAHHRPKIWKILLGYLPANTSRHTTTLTRRRGPLAPSSSATSSSRR